MLFWGLSLRSGWGVPKDERLGFYWLRRACDAHLTTGAPHPDERDRERKEATVIGTDVVMALCEVAHSFFHGLGCAKVCVFFFVFSFFEDFSSAKCWHLGMDRWFRMSSWRSSTLPLLLKRATWTLKLVSPDLPFHPQRFHLAKQNHNVKVLGCTTSTTGINSRRRFGIDKRSAWLFGLI